ncbi:MAG: DUF2914 domain-containing protein [Desulfobacterales bacterium]
MQTVGTYLKREREAKNISLGEVAQLTKISQFYLDFLEKDDYEKLPQGPYIKGYISSYARLIGSSADEALKLYNSLQEQMKPAESFQTERLEPVTPTTTAAAVVEGKNGSSVKDRLTSVKSRTAASVAEFFASEAFAAPMEKFSASLKKAASVLKAAIPSSAAITSSIRAAGTSINAGGRRLAKAGSSLRNCVPVLSAPILKTLEAAGGVSRINRLIFNRRSWLYAGGILVGSGILVLAGFGFYHLFIFQKNSLPTAAVLTPHDGDVKPAVAARPEAVRIPSPPPVAAPAAVPPVEINSAAVASLPAQGSVGLKTPPPSDAAAGETPGAPVSEEKSSAPRSVPAAKGVQTEKPISPPVKSGGGEAPATKDASTKSRPQPLPAQAPARPAPSNLSVAQASISSNVKDRMPAGVSTSFPWSTARVYVWNLVNAKNYPSKIRHIYYFGGQKISDVELNIRSFSWRTWSYQTIADKRYKGIWQVDIATLDGQVLESLHFEVN